MGKINSKKKGNKGEREAAELIRAFGFKARRGQQFSGGGDSPDVVHSIPGIHIEVKRTERLNIYDAIEQAERDVKMGHARPVVLHRKSRKQWLAIMPATDLLQILLERELS